MKALTLIIALCVALALAVAGCGGSGDSSTRIDRRRATTARIKARTDTNEDQAEGRPCPKGAPPKKLEIKDLDEGTGAEAKAGDKVTVQYVGVNYKNARNSTPPGAGTNRSPSPSAPAK